MYSRSLSVVNSLRSRSFNTSTLSASAEIEFPTFSNAVEIIEYVESHIPTADNETLLRILGISSLMLKKLPDGREFRNSLAMKKLISAATSKFSSQDSNASTLFLQKIAGFAPSRKSKSPVPVYLKKPGETFYKLLVSNAVSFSASDFVAALSSLCRLDVKDLQLCNFVEKNLPNYISKMTSLDCRLMIDVLHCLGTQQRDLYKILADKLIENLDQFNNDDVVFCLDLFARTRFVPAEVLKKCIELLTERASVFDVRELVFAAESLIQLNQFWERTRVVILNEIENRFRDLNIVDLCRTLVILCGSRAIPRLANEIIGYIESSPLNEKFMNLNREIDIAHTICTFNLQERKPLLETLIQNVFAAEFVSPPNLLRIVEIAESAKHDMDMKVELPQSIRSQLEELYANQKIGGYTIMVKELIEKLPDKYQLAVETGIRVGPFMPSLVDEKNKVVIEVQTETVPIRLRTHLYEKLGYFPVSIFSTPFRGAKDENFKIETLQYLLAPALVKLGRIKPEEFETLREARRGYRESFKS